MTIKRTSDLYKLKVYVWVIHSIATVAKTQAIGYQVGMRDFTITVYYILLLGCSLAHSVLAATQDGYNLPTLEKKINQKKIRDISSMISEMVPVNWDRWPSTDVVLAFHSEGLSKPFTSAEEPRIMLFNNFRINEKKLSDFSSQMILAFSGRTQGEGSGVVEGIHYDDNKGTFDLFMIDFNVKPGPQISMNPARCQQCHGTSHRPIWDNGGGTLFSWPGIYGSSHGLILKNSNEEKQLLTFLSGVGSRPIYGLKTLGLDSQSSLISSAPTGTVSESSPVIGIEDSILQMNHVRILQEIYQSPEYARYRYALLAAAKNCVDIEAFIPEARKSKFPRSLKDLETETETAFLKDYPADLASRTTLTGAELGDQLDSRRLYQRNALSTLTLSSDPTQFFSQGSAIDIEFVARLRYLFENRGVDVASWSMSLNPKFYQFVKGTWFASSLSGAIFDRLPILDPSLKTDKIIYKNCNDLKDISLQSLKDF